MLLTASELGNSSQQDTARILSLHFFQSPAFIAFEAATICSRILSGGPFKKRKKK